MRFKIAIVLLNCLLTFINQLVYHYIPAADSLRYLEMARQYSEFNFFDPSTNCFGHPFYPLFLAMIGNIISYHHYVIGLIQSLIFCLTVLFLTGELEIYLNKKLTGIILIVLLIPEIHIYNGYILTESISISLTL